MVKLLKSPPVTPERDKFEVILRALLYGHTISVLPQGFNVTSLHVSGNKCVYIPRNLKEEHIVCPSDHLERIIEVAQALEVILNIKSITILEI